MNNAVLWKFLNVLIVLGVSAAEQDEMKRKSVKEGESVSLDPGVIKTNPNDLTTWFFNYTLIAEITGDQSKICTDDQCDERFRDRLKLDHQTGSLTIMNITNTDSGLYHLQIISSSIIKSFIVTVTDASGADTDGESVSVMDGDSVTLHTEVETNQHHRIRWYFNDIRIAQINRDQRKICRDDQCKERFRDRLKLDHQTGSLTIMNTRTTDSGLYQLEIISSSISEKTFNVSVYDVPAENNEMRRSSVKEGESATFDPGVIKKLNNLMTWYFDDVRIAEITGDQSKICTDVRCKERFRDRLKVDHQTGSLTITNTRTTDSGEYQLHIISSSSIIIIKSFCVTVTDSGLSPAAVGGICVVVLFVAVAVGANNIYYMKGISNMMNRREYSAR